MKLALSHGYAVAQGYALSDGYALSQGFPPFAGIRRLGIISRGAIGFRGREFKNAPLGAPPAGGICGFRGKFRDKIRGAAKKPRKRNIGTKSPNAQKIKNPDSWAKFPDFGEIRNSNTVLFLSQG